MFEENRLKLGIFVILGVSMIVAFLFLLGVKDALKPRLYVYTYFTETVQGLEVGSAVKFKGVTVGSVSSISIHQEGKKIRVEMKTNPSAFQAHDQQFNAKVARELFTSMVKNGLGCEQKLTGITGMKVIEINYFNDNLAEEDSATKPPEGEYFLPAHRSALEDSLQTVSSVIHKIGNVDFEQISKDLSETISGINKLINDGDISKIIKSVEASTMNVEKLIAEVTSKIKQADIKNISAKLSQTLSAYEKLAIDVNKEVKSINLNKLSSEAKSSLTEVTVNIKQLKASLAATLKKGNRAIIEVQRIIEDLNEDPSAIIHGKQKKAVFPVKQ